MTNHQQSHHGATKRYMKSCCDKAFIRSFVSYWWFLTINFDFRIYWWAFIIHPLTLVVENTWESISRRECQCFKIAMKNITMTNCLRFQQWFHRLDKKVISVLNGTCSYTGDSWGIPTSSCLGSDLNLLQKVQSRNYLSFAWAVRCMKLPESIVVLIFWIFG